MLEVIEIEAMSHYHGQEDNGFLQAIVILVRVKERAAKFHGAEKQTRTTCPVIEAKHVVEPRVNHNRGQTILEDNLNILLVAKTGAFT